MARDIKGSPPHTWRILTLWFLLCIDLRITSTHVENTACKLFSFLFERDHLHTRGEYFTNLILIGQRIGSPPHTWRIPRILRPNINFHRITSTHVENTVNKSQYNNNHKTIDPKISSLCQLLLYLFLSHQSSNEQNYFVSLNIQ